MEIRARLKSFAEPALRIFSVAAVIITVAVAVSQLLMNVNWLDEGLAAMLSLRISQGEVIYRDFFSVHAPLTFLILGNLYKVFGATILTGRFFALAVSLLYLMMVVLCLERHVKDRLSSTFVISLLCYCGFLAWPYPSHHVLAPLFAVTAIYFFFRGNAAVDYFLCGGFSALAFWTLQDEGFYLILCMVAILLILREPLRSLAAYASGGFAFSLPVLLYLLVLVPVKNLYEDLLRYPLVVYHADPKAQFQARQFFGVLTRIWESGQFVREPVFSVALTVSACFVIALPLAALVLSTVMFAGKAYDRRALLGYLALYASFMGALFHHVAYKNLQFMVAAPAFLVVYFIHVRGLKSAGFRKTAGIFMMVVSCCFLAVGLKSAVDVFRPDALYALKTRAGTTYSLWRGPTLNQQEIVDQIEKNVPEKGYLLSREMPIFNFLTKRPNPIGMDYFQPPYNPSEEWTRELIRKMDDRGLEWILTFRHKSARSVFDDYLEANYEPFFQNRAYILWKRKSAISPPSPPQG